jgi:hypothetical protein
VCIQALSASDGIPVCIQALSASDGMMSMQTRHLHQHARQS